MWNGLDPSPVSMLAYNDLFLQHRILRGMAGILKYHVFSKQENGTIELHGSYTAVKSGIALKETLFKRYPDRKIMTKIIDGYDAAKAWAEQHSK